MNSYKHEGTFAIERVGGVTTIRYDRRITTEATRRYRRGVFLRMKHLADAGIPIADAAVEITMETR